MISGKASAIQLYLTPSEVLAFFNSSILLHSPISSIAAMYRINRQTYLGRISLIQSKRVRLIICCPFRAHTEPS